VYTKILVSGMYKKYWCVPTENCYGEHNSISVIGSRYKSHILLSETTVAIAIGMKFFKVGVCFMSYANFIWIFTNELCPIYKLLLKSMNLTQIKASVSWME